MLDEIEAIQIAHNEILCCPCCGEPNGLHQNVATLYNGADAITEVTAEGFTRTWPNDPQQSELNPSAHRHGLTLHFWCEFCHVDPNGGDNRDGPSMALRIYQHKGQTFINWLVDVADE